MTTNMAPSEDGKMRELLDSFEYRFCRRFMIALRRMARVPLVDNAVTFRANRKPLIKSGQERCELMPREEQAYCEAAVLFGPVSDLAFTLFLISMTHLSLVLYHQYKLDWSRVRYDYLIFRRSLGSDDSRCFGFKCCRRPVPEELLQELNKTIQEENRVLDLLGHPLQHVTYFGASTLCVLFTCNFLANVIPRINFSFLNPYDSDIFRILVDYKRELKLCRLLVNEQVDEFLGSHRNSTRTLAVQRFANGHYDRRRLEEAVDEAQELMERDSFIEHELLALLARNELLPANRRVEWIRSWLGWYLLASLSGFTASLVGSALLIWMIFLLPTDLHTSDKPWLEYHLNDWLFILETCLIMSLLSFSMSLFTSTLTFSSFDQWWLAKDLRRQHEHLLSESQAQMDLPSRRRVGTQRDRLNRELVALLIKFRIFVRQLASERKSGGFNACGVLMSFFILPVVSRLHAPYFDPSLTGINLFLVVASVFVLVAVSIGLLPPCEMFSQCVLLHRAQVKLLAHLVEVEQLRPNFYNGHLVSRLRRETSSSARLKDDFAISFAGFHFTYSSVIRFYFWFGALLLATMLRSGSVLVPSEEPSSILNSSASLADTNRPRRNFPIVVDTILEDPFGILSW